MNNSASDANHTLDTMWVFVGVCLAFAEALVRFGVPEEVLTDNGGDRDGSGDGILSAWVVALRAVD